jgi:hypothetical protein
VVFPAPLMSTIQELGAFLAREQAARTTPPPAPTPPTLPAAEVPAAVGQGADGAPTTGRDEPSIQSGRDPRSAPMTQPPPPTEPFAQHPRLAELVTALGFRRYRLFLAGLLYEEPGGPLRRATAVASRDGDLLAYDAGEVFEHAGRVPTSRLFDDDLTGRSPKTLLDEFRRLADRHERGFMVEHVMELPATS